MITPLHDRILVKPIPQESTTRGGLIIPDAAKDPPLRGTVVAVGQGHREGPGEYTPLDVSPGDIVVFGKYSGNEVRIEHEDHVVIREEDVMLVERGA